jgi:hypothetical protein
MTDLSSSLEEARGLLFIIAITLRTIDRQSNDWRVEGYAFRDVATKNAAELIWCMILQTESRTDLNMLIKIKLPSENSLGTFDGPFPIESGKGRRPRSRSSKM